MAGCIVGFFEVVIVYLVFQVFLSLVYPKTESEFDEAVKGTQTQESKSNLGGIAKVVTLSTLAGFGWFYYFVITSVFWNFISYMMLVGLVLVGPLIFTAYRRYNKSTSSTPEYIRTERRDTLARRVIAGGILLGLICLVMFPNVTLMPQQVERHFYPSFTVVSNLLDIICKISFTHV